MKERPILFSAPMVRALLDGSKTQTRRPVNRLLSFGQITEFQKSETPGYDWIFRDIKKLWNDLIHARVMEASPYGQPGDRLWVRETWWWGEEDNSIIYRADADSDIVDQNKHDTGFAKYNWRPSIFMPRVVSRITLEIVSVRVERLQDIGEADAVAEGCKTDAPITWWQGYKDAGDDLGLIHQQTTGKEPPDWMIEPHKMNPTPWLVRSAKTHYQTLWLQINGPGSWDANPWVWVIGFRRLTQ